MDTTPATLESLQTILAYHAYPTSVQPLPFFTSGQGPPEAQLYHLLAGPWQYRISPTDFDPERSTALSLLFLNDVYWATGQETDPNVDMLQWLIQLPFSVPASQQADVAALIRICNGLLPLGNFTLGDDGIPALRYVWQLWQRQVDGLLLLEIADSLLFFSGHLGYQIEAVAMGTRSLAEVSRAPLDLALPPVPS